MSTTNKKPRSVALTGRAARSGFVQVREPGSNWLLFLYDPERQLIEVQRRGVKHLIDLRELKKGD
jgi:hypothetical protein